MNQKPPPTENIAQFLTSVGYTPIPFRQNIAGQVLINAKINGVDGVYILDTGAGATVVDAKQATIVSIFIVR